MPTHSIDRVTPLVPTPGSTFLAGAAEVDITPPIGFPLAGYSMLARVAQGVAGRLFARTLLLQDVRGERVALCFADLWSGSRYLLEKAATITAPRCGIGPDRLVLAGTHTHTGPAWFCGTSLYDTVASKEPGFDSGLADFLAAGIARSVTEAAAALRPARVGTAVRKVWGVSRNRSDEAFALDPEAARWNGPPFPGADAPAELTLEQRQIDPRLTVIAAFDGATRTPIAVFGIFGCHATSIGPEADYYSPDWPGHAVRTARAQIESATGNGRVVVAMAPSAEGDVNALREGIEPEIEAGGALAAFVGGQVGRELAAAARDALEHLAAAADLDVRYAEPALSHGADLRPDLALAEQWYLGAPTLAGSEDSPSPLQAMGLAWEGMAGDDFPASDPQHPKMRGLGIVQDIARGLLHLEPSPQLPLHAVRIGSHLFATVPGEPTTMAAYRIERALMDATQATAVTVLGCAGDYSGYYTTREEYGAQHYEGSSMLYGRNAAAHLAARLVRVATAQESADTAAGQIRFNTGPDRHEYQPGDDCRPGVDPAAQVSRSGQRVEVLWRMPRGCRVSFEGRFFVRLETRTIGSWEPLRYQGRDFDDVNQLISIRRNPLGLDSLLADPEGERWYAALTLPDDLGPEQPLQVRVAARGGFPGFLISMPS